MLWQYHLNSTLMDKLTYPKELKKVGNNCRTPEHHIYDDNSDHGLENIHLCARQTATGCCCCTLLMYLSRGLVAWRGGHCGNSHHGNALTTTHVTSDYLALTSDSVKYSCVAVDEYANRDEVIPAQPTDRKCLPDNHWIYVQASIQITMLSICSYCKFTAVKNVITCCTMFFYRAANLAN